MRFALKLSISMLSGRTFRKAALSDFISSHLSLLLTNLINSTLQDNGLISGVDFDVGVRNNNLAIGSAATSNLFPDEIEVRLKNKFRFMDERLSLNLG